MGQELTIDDALEILSDWHSVYLAPVAECVYAIANVLFDEKLLIRWKDSGDAARCHGFTAENDGSGSGVRGLDLSYYVAEKLGIG